MQIKPWRVVCSCRFNLWTLCVSLTQTEKELPVIVQFIIETIDRRLWVGIERNFSFSLSELFLTAENVFGASINSLTQKWCLHVSHSKSVFGSCLTQVFSAPQFCFFYRYYRVRRIFSKCSLIPAYWNLFRVIQLSLVVISKDKTVLFFSIPQFMIISNIKVVLANSLCDWMT